MTQQSAVIKVLCCADALQDTATMLQWALGHRIEVEKVAPGAKVGNLIVFTDVEFYENDTALFERLGFDIIGKIRGVVSWEMLPQAEKEGPAAVENERLEAELMHRLCTLPITVSIMPRMEGKFAWKCLEASGQAETFGAALEEALTHLTRTFKLIRSELLG
jgi:hypothetical protein